MATNCCTSVLLPAFQFQSRSAAHIKETCRMQFGADNEKDFDMFALVPLTQETIDGQTSPNFEIAVRMNSSSFTNLTLRNVENSMLEKQRC